MGEGKREGGGGEGGVNTLTSCNSTPSANIK